MADLSNLTDLKAYLNGTPFASSRISILSGGSGNFTCRLHLGAPYEGRSTLVLKHAKPHVFTMPDLPFSLDRQKFEVEALKIITESTPDTSFVTVPKVYLFDEKEAVIIIDDCGEHSTTLKQFVLDGKCTPELAEKIGSELGTFLRRVHAITRENNPTACDMFAGNEQAKRMSAFVTHGRLVSTLTGKDNLPAIHNPVMPVDDEDMKVIKESGEKTSLLITQARDMFVMGDFWPGNILLALDSSDGSSVKGISVIDWELAKTGLPAVDLGQFTAEIDLLRKFCPSEAAACTKLISTFFKSYSFLAEEAARLAVRHWGAHLITWTPRVAWGNRQDTRDSVNKGVRLMVNSVHGDAKAIYGLLEITVDN